VHTDEPGDAGEGAEDVENMIAVEYPRDCRDIHKRQHERRGPFGAWAASRGCVSAEGGEQVGGRAPGEKFVER